MSKNDYDEIPDENSDETSDDNDLVTIDINDDNQNNLDDNNNENENNENEQYMEQDDDENILYYEGNNDVVRCSNTFKFVFLLSLIIYIALILLENINDENYESLHLYIMAYFSILVLDFLVLCIQLKNPRFKNSNINRFFNILIFICTTLWIIWSITDIIHNSNRSDSPLYKLYILIIMYNASYIALIFIILIWYNFKKYIHQNQTYESLDNNNPYNYPGLAAIGVTNLIQQNTYISEFGKLMNIPELDNDHTCCICYEDYEQKDKLMLLPCKHYYHEYCIKRWLQQNNTCPKCRVHVYQV